MHTVILRKDGFYLHSWNEETRAYDPDRLLDDGNWLLEWTEDFELEGTVTLGDVFAILAKLDPHDINLFSALSRLNIAPFLAEAQKPLTEARSDIDYIEMYRFIEVSWYKRKGLPRFESYVTASGRTTGDLVNYSLDFTPVNKLLHCEIRLSPIARFYDTRDHYNEKGKFVLSPHNPPFDEQPWPPEKPATVDGKPCECKECCGERFSTSYKLGECMWALFDDITFNGTPEARDEMMEMLIQRKDECLEAEAKGEIEVIDSDDLD